MSLISEKIWLLGGYQERYLDRLYDSYRQMAYVMALLGALYCYRASLLGLDFNDNESTLGLTPSLCFGFDISIYE